MAQQGRREVLPVGDNGYSRELALKLGSMQLHQLVIPENRPPDFGEPDGGEFAVPYPPHIPPDAGRIALNPPRQPRQVVEERLSVAA